MTALQSVLLGIIQGITEFLPISSSGHLKVVRELMGLGGIPILFDILMHIPTLIALVLVFRKRIAELTASAFRLIKRSSREEDRENLKLLLVITIATVFTGTVGFILSKLYDSTEIPVKITGILFILTGIALIISRFFQGSKDFGDLRMHDGIITGLAQGISVFPGLSRSGITITASLAVGLARKRAGEYAFLISIPAILGALTLKIKEIELLHINPLIILSGMAASFVTGLAALIVLLQIIRRGRLYLFSIYLIPLGIAVFLFLS